MNSTFKVHKRQQLRCGWMDTPEGRIIKIRTEEGENKIVLVVDYSDEYYFVKEVDEHLDIVESFK
jgi:hypothetical protein